MRSAKTVTIILMLVLGGLALELNSTTTVRAADDLTDTRWANSKYVFMFEKGGVVEVDFGECCGLAGNYRVNGGSVEMTFEDKTRASATISGNKMSVKQTNSDNSIEEFILTKQK